MKEKWIKGYKCSYSIDKDGNVFSHSLTLKERRRVKLSPETTKVGYQRVLLYLNGKSKHKLIHRLVVEAFIGEIPKNKVVDHINGNKLDNRLENLQIITQRENIIRSKSDKEDIGACFEGKKWASAICINGKQIRLGSFDTKEEASAEYQRALKEFNDKKEITRPHINGKTSEYRGVSKSHGRKGYNAAVRPNGKDINLGCYLDEEKAANAVIEFYGRFDKGESVESIVTDIKSKRQHLRKLKGVSFNKNRKKWHAYTYIDKKRKHIGFFKTEEEAIQAKQNFKID